MAADSSQRPRGRWRLLKRSGEPRSGTIVHAADEFVSRLMLPAQASWTDLQTAVESIYGKPIYLIASNSSALQSVTGLWIDSPTFGAVVCRERDEVHYQSQNAFHELAHVLFIHAPEEWFNDLLPRRTHDAATWSGATQLCASTDDPESESARAEIAVEEVAYAMARRIQSLNRTNEEMYFG